MALSDILSALFSVGSAAAGSQGGGSTGGILSSLGSIFGEASPQGNRPGLATALSGLGQLAGSFRATPNEGATEEDIKKANRYNMLAGILGGLGTIAGGELGRRYQDEGKAELAKILGGAGTTTGQEIPTSQKLAKWIEQYPTLASDETLKLQLGMQEKEADRTLKQMDVLRKAMTGGLREVDLYNIAESRGVLPEDRAAWVERERQKRAQEGLSSLGLMGLKLPQQSATAEFTQAPSPTATGGTIAQDILRKADKGQEFDITVPADQAESVMKGLEQSGYQEQPVTAKPNFATTEEQRGAERRQEQESRTKSREEGKAFLDFYAINKEPFTDLQRQSTEAPKTYDTIVSQLMSDDPSVQQNGLTALLAARDESVVQIGELDRFNETVYTPLEKLNRQAQALFGKRLPLSQNIRDALIASAKDVRDIKMQAGDAADKSIRKASEENALGNRKISGISEYRKNYKSIRDWLGEKNRDQNNPIMSTPNSVQIAPTQSYRPRRIMKIEPLG